MQTITYQSISAVPEAMRLELAQARTADVAEAIYQAWANRCFVELRSRAAIWMAV